MSWPGGNTDGITVDNGDCPCNGEKCSGAHGWTWKSADLGNSAHRGRMWAEVCPSWATDEKYWCVESGTFKPCPPPTPPGMTDENFSRFLSKKAWDNVEMSAEDKSMNLAHEGRGRKFKADAGSHIDDTNGVN